MKNWQKKERRDAKDFGGKRVVGSGSQWYAPGDVKTAEYLIDAKTTDNKSYGLKIETWNKIAEEAAFSDRTPLLSLKIQETELVVIQRMDFLNLLKRLE